MGYVGNGDGEADEEGQGDEDADIERGEDDQGSESVGTTETFAPLSSTASFTRVVESAHYHSHPSNLDHITIGRSHSLSAVGGMEVSDLRVSVMCCVLIKTMAQGRPPL